MIPAIEVQRCGATAEAARAHALHLPHDEQPRDTHAGEVQKRRCHAEERDSAEFPPDDGSTAQYA